MRPETTTAIRAARVAQRLADSREGADAVTFKDGIDIVTGADVACEDAIRTELTRDFPDYAVVGEERGGTPRDGAPYWLVDPICGTRCYASNVPLYCTNIALVEDGSGDRGRNRSGKDRRDLLRRARRRSVVLTRWRGGCAAARAEHAQQHAVDRRAPAARGRSLAASRASRPVVFVDVHLERLISLSRGRPHPGLVHFAYDAAYRDPPVHTAAGCFVSEEAGAIVTDLATGGAWTWRPARSCSPRRRTCIASSWSSSKRSRRCTAARASAEP